MSNIRDSVSERNVDICRPSTSQPASQPFRSKSSLNNKVKEKEHKVASPSKKSAKHTSMSRQKQDEAKIASRTFTNSSINDLPSQCQNLNINSESDDVDQGDTPVVPKKKNMKKKERLKQLKLQMPPANTVPPTPPPTAQSMEHANYVVQNQMTSVQEFFMNQIGPLYASTSSRYLENLTHHPQYQYMQHSIQAREVLQARQHLASVPNSPFLHMVQRPNSANVPNSSFLHSEPNTPRYLQNAMQHPLLCKSFSVESHARFDQRQHPTNIARNSFGDEVKGPVNQENGNKATKKKKRTHAKNDQADDKKFDCYLSPEEVEEGLKNNTLIEGIVRINPKQFQHSYVSSTDRSEQDVLIDGIKHRNRALEGDVVVVQILCESNSEDNVDKQKKGKVVYIKEKVHTRTCIGTLKLMPDKNRQKALFVPRDHRVPRLNIPFTSWPDNFYHDAKSYENTLFLAKILDWTDTRFALGKIVCNIGQSGNMITETKAILVQTDLDITPYGPEYRDLYPRLDYVIPEEEITLREDCRKLCIFSIDPSNCRDIDDAVSCRELENGNYEIGVHISDVAHFLTENTALDEKVAEKATTIYMVDKAYHMLPDELCMLCSLFPGVDKLAFSVFWEITPEGKVLSNRFSKTVIHSCCQLAYDHAQAILEDRKDAETIFPETYNGYEYKDIYKTIKILGKIAAIFRQNRFDGGALRIDQPKVSFHLNPTDMLPESYWIYESKESHQLIEEFMLLANMTVAGRIHEDHPKLAFLRCHPPPSAYMLKQLAKSLKPMGIDLDVSSAGDLHKSLLPFVGPECTDKGKAMVLNMLCAKPMTRAKYFCSDGCDDEDFHHYALNVPLYTHFTSPIRRYADIMVHRLLAASLKYRENPNWEVDKVRMIAAQCNKQKYNAKKAGELSTELYTLKYIELHSPLVTDAVVVEVREKYIDVIIVAMGLNRRIFFNNDFPGDYKCIKNDKGVKLSKMELTWRATDNLPEVAQIIEVFSILQVEMHKGDDMVKVETKLVRPQ
ncbi:DIS3-like exonuclease 2 [Pectinophora gossypiella]|uniref:DIS3-like exonuclease 2 n=1 Tax=Pectinophora gossypiella TaxID=13191 RepID=UPI00214F2257|nr:DIS3-like exonuclease 2 [Pectinophora gossypiella]